MSVEDVFKRTAEAIESGRPSASRGLGTKGPRFRDWFGERLDEAGQAYLRPGRGRSSDFQVVDSGDRYYSKGLPHPGRGPMYHAHDANERALPDGHNIYYVVGRYRAGTEGSQFRVLDLIMCHREFLEPIRRVSADSVIGGYGSYGDIKVRVQWEQPLPNPFRLLQGAANQATLILPDHYDPGPSLVQVGVLIRREPRDIVIAIVENFVAGTVTAGTAPNPTAGQEHTFRAWRLKGSSTDPVFLTES